MISKLNKLFIGNRTINQQLLKKLATRNLTTSQQKSKMAPIQDDSSKIVWMDLEMTGLDVINDKILEVACLITDKDLNIIATGPCFAINYPDHVFEGMNDWCKKHHIESGLVERCTKSQITTDQGEELLLEFLKKHVPKGKCPLAGNSIYMDRLFLRQHMSYVDAYMHYRIIDVSTIKELASRWDPILLDAAPKKKFAHRSLDDISDSINELKYYKQTFFKDNDLKSTKTMNN